MQIIPKLWQIIAGRKNTSDLALVAKRFLRVFNDHGVQTSQIPRLLPQLRLDDLQSPEKLLTALTPEILDQTAKLFGIRIEWLEGADDCIYNYLATGKDPKIFFEYLSSLNIDPEEVLGFPFRVITNTKQPDYKNPEIQHFALVLVEKIAQLGEEPIYRYHIFRDGFKWSHRSARIELKAITRVVCKAYNTLAPLFVVSDNELDRILEGKVIPAKYVHGCQITNPSLEDYAESKDESVVAKETDELPAVLEYIAEHHLDEIVARLKADKLSAGSSTASEEAIKHSEPTGKRAQTQRELWDPVRIAARLIWAEDGSLTIEKVIQRIKAQNVSKASAFSPSAIRKHIADLAPPGANKPGRKPKKST